MNNKLLIIGNILLVYSLGIRVTAIGLACNAVEILSFVFKILLMVLFIHNIQRAMEINFKFNRISYIISS